VRLAIHAFQSTRPRGARPPASPSPGGRRRFNPRAHGGRDWISPVSGVAPSTFQSTRPRGARPVELEPVAAVADVSIHAPTGGATKCSPGTARTFASFNPRAHGGRDRAAAEQPRGRPSFNPRAHGGRDGAQLWSRDRRDRSFNPRAHGGRDVVRLDHAVGVGVVSIHAPTGGATSPRSDPMPIQEQFQSTRPRGARHVTKAERGMLSGSFNPRAHGGRDCCEAASMIVELGFNPRAHGGRDSTSLAALARRSRFQSTRPRGARPDPCRQASRDRRFNPRAHGGRDSRARSGITASCGFNPRAHGGRDAPAPRTAPASAVSIHAPTGGATGNGAEFARMGDVSIHAPTGGATQV